MIQVYLRGQLYLHVIRIMCKDICHYSAYPSCAKINKSTTHASLFIHPFSHSSILYSPRFIDATLSRHAENENLLLHDRQYRRLLLRQGPCHAATSIEHHSQPQPRLWYVISCAILLRFYLYLFKIAGLLYPPNVRNRLVS